MQVRRRPAQGLDVVTGEDVHQHAGTPSCPARDVLIAAAQHERCAGCLAPDLVDQLGIRIGRTAPKDPFVDAGI